MPDAARRKTKDRDNIKKLKGIIKMQVPVQARCNAPVSITINHNLPSKLQQQPLQVTVKDSKGERIERKILNVSGKGTQKIIFDLPPVINGNAIEFAAFIGKDFPNCFEHIKSKQIRLEKQ